MSVVGDIEQQVNVDIIGDIHGCYDALVRLLIRLGYCEIDGVYQHSERTAVFVGDLIDRGPYIRETLALVKAMHDTGNARVILGNHEYNALLFRDELIGLLAGDEQVLPKRMRALMKETIEQFYDFPDQWEMFTEWFATLPLFIEGPGYRVVHACWDDAFIEHYKNNYPISGINEQFIEASKQKGSTENRMVDRLTRGTSMPLPDGMAVHSKDGFIRRFFRTKFWAASPKTYGDVVFQPDPLPYDLADHPIHEDHEQDLVYYDKQAVPVFFGHYWLKGRPKPLKRNVACLDYSAVNFGRLTSYRFSGEASLSTDNYFWVYVDPAEGKQNK